MSASDTGTITLKHLTAVRSSDIVGRLRLAPTHRTLYNWIARGTFPEPSAKIGRDNIWRLSDVEAWLAEREAARK